MVTHYHCSIDQNVDKSQPTEYYNWFLKTYSQDNDLSSYMAQVNLCKLGLSVREMAISVHEDKCCVAEQND